MARGRASCSNPVGRFEKWSRERSVEDDPFLPEEAEPAQVKTVVFIDKTRTIISRNTSPDVPFDSSINPYRGCEHGCIYCFARPSHAYLGLSPGLDFETRLFAKPEAATLLEAELSKASYRPTVIAMGTNTDPYQPIEKKWEITRRILEVLERFNNPVTITTKSGIVVRDLDILQRMARKNLARVFISVTTLKNEIARTLEPRASSPQRRLAAIRSLSDAGIPTGVLVAPVIPALTDSELESILQEASESGASSAAYILLRLPLEVADLFSEWLQAHHPLKARHVESLIAQMRDGAKYDPRFGKRMTGTGIFAETLRMRFDLACKKLGLNTQRHPLSTEHFDARRNGPQASLF